MIKTTLKECNSPLEMEREGWPPLSLGHQLGIRNRHRSFLHQ